MNTTPDSWRTRLLSPSLLVGSGVSMYLGAALAVGLFDVLSPTIVAWLRISAGALVLLAIFRPRPRDFFGVAGRNAAIYGVATMAMNMTFYEAIARIPLGTAVAIEFLGPILIAAVGSRSGRDWLALFFAAAGVVVISGASWADSASGVLFALLAGAMWAAYIVTGSRIAGSGGSSGKSMAVGFTWAAVAAIPLVVLLWPEDVAMAGTTLLLLALGLGFFSSVIPYSLDQVVMRMAGPAYFAVLQAILPVVAAVVGALALGQWLSLAEVAGIVLVVVAVVVKRP